MQNVGLISVNSNSYSITENKLVLVKGQTIRAEVLNNTNTGVLLKVNNTILHAQTDVQFLINTPILLTVMDQNKHQIILSLNRELNLYNLDLSTIIKNLDLEDSDYLRLIINKLVEKKQKLSRKNIDTLKILINKLPLESKDSLDILTDSTLYAAIFSFLDKESQSFSLLLNEREDNSNKEPYLEINVFYQSETLGNILINVIWKDKIKIELTCSTNATYQLLKIYLDTLKKKIVTLTQNSVNIMAVLDNTLLEKIKILKEKKETLLGIDIRI